MFLITDKTDYLVGRPFYHNSDVEIWITKDKNKATKYTFKECFELFEKYPDLKKEKFSCVEVVKNG